MNKPKNENYAAVIVEIKTLISLEGCDNVQSAIIMGNQVIVSKDVKVGDIGLYFPLECQLSKEYLSNNNLYKKPELNVDNTKKGYFDENGRVRCQRFKGYKSEGFFMPLISINYFLDYSEFEKLKVGDCFDELNGASICSKYVIKQDKTPGQPGSKKIRSTKKYESKVIENQFRFHQDTTMLYRNLDKIKPENLISITYKMHGTSGISSYVLCKKHITKWSRFKGWLWELSNKIENPFRKTKYTYETNDEEYDYLYSSRKVIKNADINPNVQHYYEEDIWGIAHSELKDYLQKGMTFYYEIVGFLPNGGYIQKDYDYGCKPREHSIYIYRITSTNIDGKVIEFSARQVQDFCKKNGLNAVPELYYGYAKNCFANIYHLIEEPDQFEQNWNEEFLVELKKKYNEKDCYMCINKVPEEGVVVRIEGNDFEAYKQKSELFYQRETKLLDKGVIDIEE